MAYDEGLAQRLREVFGDQPNIVERRMFGGIAFMVNGHMSCGVTNENLMVRVGPEQYQEALSRPYAREMDFTGRPLKGFIYVDPDGFESDQDIISWVRTSLDFVMTLPPK